MLGHGKLKALRIQKILQHLLPVLGEDGFGVELDAVDEQFALGETHDFDLWGFVSAVVFIARLASFRPWPDRCGEGAWLA